MKGSPKKQAHFERVIKYLVILIVGIYALIINQYILEGEYLHYKKAWQSLYSQEREDGKIRLDKVWNDSQ